MLAHHKIVMSSVFIVRGKDKNKLSTNNEPITNNQFGQSLIEVLITLVVLMLMVVAFIAVVTNSLKNSQFAQKQVQATKYAQEAMDKVKTIRDLNNSSMVSFQDPSGSSISSCQACTSVVKCSFLTLFDCNLTGLNSPCTKPLLQSSMPGCYFKLATGGQLVEPVTDPMSEDLGDGLSRTIFIQDGADYGTAKTVTVKVSWTDSSGSHESNLQTILVPR